MTGPVAAPLATDREAPSVTPLNVCHVITGLNTGGAETMLRKLIATTEGKGVTNAVVSLTDHGPLGEELASTGTPLHVLGMPRGTPQVRALGKLRDMLASQRPHILHTWMYHANLFGGLAARLERMPTVLWNIRAARLEPGSESRTTIWVARGSAHLARFLCRRIVTNSEEARRVHEQLGYPASLFEVIPNGFDLSRFRPNPDARAAVRAELGIPADAVLIGLIARFHPAKDHGTFLDAAARLAAQRSDVHFVLAGDDVAWNNPALARHIDRAGIRARTHLLGRRTDLHRIFAALDLCALSSLYESFPNVLGEAMASGVLCVTTNVGDAAEIVGDTGIVVPTRAPAALADGASSLLALDPAVRRDLARRARQRVVDRYSLGAVAERYMRVYRELVSDK